jgi:hypothetical protein
VKASLLGASSLVALLIVQVSGCSSASTSPDGGASDQVCIPTDAGPPSWPIWTGVDAGPDGEPLERFLGDYYSAFCDAQRRCLPFAGYLVPACIEQLEASATWSSVPECRHTVEGVECESLSYDLSTLPLQVADVGRGLSYDAQNASACVAAPWSTCLYAGRQVLLPEVCYSVFGPLVPDGGACQFDSECTTGSCAPAGPGTCAGTCAPPAGPPITVVPHPGGYCVYGADCGSDAGLVCDGLFCHLDAGVGANCDDVGFFGCAPGLFCDTSGTCQPQIAQGGSCLYGLDENVFLGADLIGRCQTGLVCRGEALLTDGGLRPGSCEPLAELGGPCAVLAADEVEHLSGCMAGGVCSCGACALPPTSGLCADEWTPCLPFVSACDLGGTQTCRPLSSYGSCFDGQQCSTAYCDGETCSAPPVDVGCPL